MTEELTKRKLTAILSADVKGYSRLMQDDEVETVRTISSYREVIKGLIEGQNGKVVDAKGDNLLAEFPSVVDAVRCGVMIQKELKVRNDELPENRKMEFRIGINLGDVIEERDTIYGDGVNIAARLEGLAEGGGICISRMAFDNVKSKLDVGYEYLGEHSVKNIAEPVRVYKVLMEPEFAGEVIGEERPKPKQWRFASVVSAVVLLVIAGAFSVWHFYFQPPDDRVDLRKATFPLADKPSIAVLPFQNMTGDPKQQYFCDGMAEQLISGLSQGPYIYVTARTSSFAYRGKSMTAQQIANELGVRYLVEGSVQRDSDRVRVNVQIIDGRNGNHIWAEHYDQKYEDLFALQDQIAMAVMAFLNVKITGYVIGGLKDFRPSNLKAYEYFLRGLYYHLGRSPQDVLPARQALEEAIKLDPNFVAAYAWLGHVFIDEIYFRMTKSPGKVLDRAENLANKAISLSPDNRRYGYGLLSAISRLRKDSDNAILYGEKCLELAPNDSGPHFMLAMALLLAERFEEAISTMETALQLAPFRPPNYLGIFGWALNGNKQYDKAITIFTEIIERSQNKWHHYSAYRGLTAAYELSGNHEKARWAAENIMRINPKFSIVAEEKRSFLKEGAFKKRMYDTYRGAGLPE